MSARAADAKRTWIRPLARNPFKKFANGTRVLLSTWFISRGAYLVRLMPDVPTDYSADVRTAEDEIVEHRG